MEEQFQRTAATHRNKDHEQECKKLTLCRLFADGKSEDLSEPQSKLIKLSVKLRYLLINHPFRRMLNSNRHSELVEKYGLDSNPAYPSSVHSRISDYLAAKKLGSEREASCESLFSKCTN